MPLVTAPKPAPAMIAAEAAAARKRLRVLSEGLLELLIVSDLLAIEVRSRTSLRLEIGRRSLQDAVRRMKLS
ncbi:hypothetical protein GCM10016234_04100 [Tianweitania populi]|uniref:Uncharacterized protein n=1 Tax=Tianweitania populi TaxID=1607949 RepID=A0A8J3DMG0_9HYPH|nr:hypothetical protein GCM10016234_04100 [Tianweitania populi]